MDAKVKLKKVNIKTDLELLMAWRSNPLIYKYFHLQNSPLNWSEHYKYWKSQKNTIHWIILYFQNNTWRKIGSIYISNLSSQKPEIGLFIGEVTLQGKGIGTESLKKAVDWLRTKGHKKVLARVHKKNIASRNLMEKNLFVNKGIVKRTDFMLFERELNFEHI